MFRALKGNALKIFAVFATVTTATAMASSNNSTKDNADRPKPKADEDELDSDKDEGNEDAENSESNLASLLGSLKGLPANIVEQFKQRFPHFTKQPKVFEDLTLEGVANFIKENKAKKIIVMTGAGVSTSAGIPDFRSPGTGLYHNLQKYDLPHPQAIFEIDYFHSNPEPFYALAKELFPTVLKPTVCHYFVRLLHESGLLLRVFTQNIDSLDHIAGVPADKIIEAHGSFYKNHCLKCRKEYSLDWMKEQVAKVPVPHCTECEGVIKPDVIFFGESLPSNFFTAMQNDFPECDLLIIMGTSLVVQPFASLVSRVGNKVPRLLINMEKAGSRENLFFMVPGLDYDDENNYRDIFWQGTCDDGCLLLAKFLGWEDRLKEVKEAGWKKIDEEYETQNLSEHLKANLNIQSGSEEKKPGDSTRPKM